MLPDRLSRWLLLIVPVWMLAAPVRADSSNEPIGFATPIPAFERVIAHRGKLEGTHAGHPCTLEVQRTIWKGPHGARSTYNLVLSCEADPVHHGRRRVDAMLAFDSQVVKMTERRIRLRRLSAAPARADLDIELGDAQDIRRVRARTYGMIPFLTNQSIDATFTAPREDRFRILHGARR